MRTRGGCYALLVGKLYYIEAEINYIIWKLSVRNGCMHVVVEC